MAGVKIEAPKNQQEPVNHGDFIISDGRVFMIAPFTDKHTLCLFCLDNGCTLNRTIDVQGLTPEEVAQRHEMADYVYVKNKDAEITFKYRL